MWYDRFYFDTVLSVSGCQFKICCSELSIILRYCIWQFSFLYFSLCNVLWCPPIVTARSFIQYMSCTLCYVKYFHLLYWLLLYMTHLNIVYILLGLVCKRFIAKLYVPKYLLSFDIVACHLPRGSNVLWREDIGGGLKERRYAQMAETLYF